MGSRKIRNGHDGEPSAVPELHSGGNALTRQVGSGPRQTAKPCEQCSQMGAVFLSNASEFQSHSDSALHVAHNSLGSDLPFFYEKINLCFRPNKLRCTCLNKDSPETQVPDARNIATSCANPIHTNTLRRFDAQSLPPGVGWHLEKCSHVAPVTP
jgi:hypothetical protein